MRQLILFLVIIILSGCGSTLKSSSVTSETVSFNGKNWQVTVPESWEKLPLQTDVLFMARNQDENFVILKRNQKQDNLQEQILAGVEKDFFFFEILEKTNNQWSFKGQPQADLPIRIFWQRIYPVNKSNHFLLGSCSYEVTTNKKSSCEDIIKNWEIIETTE